MYWWARENPVTDTYQEAQVSESSAIQVYQCSWDVCSTWLLLAQVIQIGGQGVVVQKDESLYCHKPKVGMKTMLKSDHMTY